MDASGFMVKVKYLKEGMISDYKVQVDFPRGLEKAVGLNLVNGPPTPMEIPVMAGATSR